MFFYWGLWAFLPCLALAPAFAATPARPGRQCLTGVSTQSCSSSSAFLLIINDPVLKANTISMKLVNNHIEHMFRKNDFSFQYLSKKYVYQADDTSK